MNEFIEIPFGANDSELKGWEYTIPEDMEAVIKDGKIIVRKKGSEDERIRKELANEVCCLRAAEEKGSDRYESLTAMLAYLEKQKKRGPLTKEEEYTLQRIVEYLEDVGCPPSWKDLLYDIYNLPYVKQELPAWSEEDAVGIDRALCILRSCRGQIPGYDTDDGISEHDDAIRTLERIQPAGPHWRPSGEQMRAFEESLMAVAYTENKTILESLYEQLKKL